MQMHPLQSIGLLRSVTVGVFYAVCGPMGDGEKPLTPLWLVGYASVLFALMLIAQFLHHKIMFFFIFYYIFYHLFYFFLFHRTTHMPVH